MKLLVTKMMKEHLEECVTLYIDTFTREPWNDTYESRQQVKTFFENHMKNNYFIGYVGIVENTIVALSIGMKKPWINGFEYYIDEFCVKYDLQGKGIGSLFIEKFEGLLNAEHIESMILNTEKDYPAQKFYEKNGFKTINNLIVLGK